MSTRVCGDGTMSTETPGSGDTSLPNAQTVMEFWGTIQLYEPMEVRQQESNRLKTLVPLREHRYRRLSALLAKARDNDRTVRDVLGDLADQAATQIESALLLRDLWEVLRTLQGRMADQSRPLCDTLLTLCERLSDQPFQSAEEVLF